ncbi:MAG: FAD-binding oxidoreductase [Alphaproteobacteria bacterium]|nr:FAD-binding oxidoreductase [Alphaproteobacteria bacterium]
MPDAPAYSDLPDAQVAPDGRLDHAPSYYAATANPASERPRLEGDVDCDVCVVGGGFTGLSAALELAKRGFDVVLLEGARIGWGASGRNGGQVVGGFSCDVASLKSSVGETGVKTLWDLSQEATQLIKDRVAEFEIDCDLRWGYVHAAAKPRHMRELKEDAAILSGVGYEGLRLLDRDETRRMVNSPAYCGGLFDPGSGHMHPLNYAIGLAAAAEQAGAKLFEASTVTAIDWGDRPRLRTAFGSVRARHVILAGNAYLGGLVPTLHARVMPVSSYIVATEPLGENRARDVIDGGVAVADAYFIVNYFRISADQRLLFGGRANYTGGLPRDLYANMRPRMLAVFPQLDDVKLEHAWGGRLAITRNRFPHLGRLNARTGRIATPGDGGATVLFAQGFSGHGVALSGYCGKLMAEAIAGRAEKFDLFARVPHGLFPGGPLRTPALVLAMLYYRLRDLL